MENEQERWVKLHLKLLDNELFYKDHTGLVLFLWCLLRAYPKGRFTTGRFQMAEAIGLNPNTAYKALKRLEKGCFVNTSSNNRFTDISICNWSKYQTLGNTSGNNTVTTEQQHSNNTVTHLENKNKNIEIEELNTVDEKYIGEMKMFWKENAGTILRNHIPENLKAYRYLLKEVENLSEYLQAVRMIRADKYQKRTLQAKLINYAGLREKLEEVEAYMQAHVDNNNLDKQVIL